MSSGTHLKIGILARTQSAHPEIRQYDLAAGMGEQGAMIGGDGQREAALIGPRVQLAGEQALRLLRVLAIAKVQQLVACRSDKRKGGGGTTIQDKRADKRQLVKRQSQAR